MYQQLESDVKDPISGLHVTFYPGKVEVPARSNITGKPEFDLVDYVRIMIPGDMLNIVERPAREGDKQQFPAQWQRYKHATEYRPESGTPIEDWPRVDVATVAKLKALGFHTVEQIAESSDAMCQNIGMGCFELRTKAIAYVEAAKDSAFVQKQADQLAQRDLEIADLKSANQGMASQMAQLTAQVSQLLASQDGGAPRKAGRPSNAELAARQGA